jgi:hypothetical protein
MEAERVTEHRRKLWDAYLASGKVRYRTVEFKCQDVTCQRWHAVTGPRSYGPYQERNQTLEDLTLDAMRTSATHGCQHPAKGPKKPPEEAGPEQESTDDECKGPEAALDVQEPAMKIGQDDSAL